jgi:hypothetical protein
MPGPAPKPSAERLRRNKEHPVAVLEESEVRDPDSIPQLPEIVQVENDEGEVVDAPRDWNRNTVRWWNALWASPIAEVFTKMDEFELVRLALLVDEVNWGNIQKDVLAEIRQMTDRFGLSPMARRRLGIVVKTGDRHDKPQPADNVVDIRKGIRQRALG